MLFWMCRTGSREEAIRVAKEGLYGSCRRTICPVYCPLDRSHPVSVRADGQTVFFAATAWALHNYRTAVRHLHGYHSSP